MNDCTIMVAGCACSDYVDKDGYGKCQKDHWFDAHQGCRPMCYVQVPSTCRDKIQSGTDPEKYFSHEACLESAVLEEAHREPITYNDIDIDVSYST